VTGPQIRPRIPPVEEHEMWRAWLAPLGVASPAGRTLASGDGRFRLPVPNGRIDFAYLLRTDLLDPHDPARVGRVEQLQTVDGWLTAVCRVWDPVTLQLLARHIHAPEFSLTDYTDDDVTRGAAGTLTFRRGTLAGIRLGVALWPDCRFTREDTPA
jgi:hypothetical protein